MAVNSCPIIMNGSSTGRPPIQVKMIQDITNVQNISWFSGQNLIPSLLLFASSGKKNKMIRAANRAITPPSLFGIDRRIAYTHRKYHSGLM